MKAIRFQNVSKKFTIGQHVTLKRKFSETYDRLFNRNKSNAQHVENILWALRDVSFEVEEGETLGLIGPNGSGKSTALKLLAKITEADSGLVEIRGLVVPLIEVGAGFHQDLTGRENIYLNGSILGLKKADIERELDSIVEFAEIAQFIDTPLKKYSSGMAVRLGFAVAIHINPDVLLVDEVLAVGDIRFQRKCITKMKEIVTSGRTVVFVSHNMPAVQSLCKRCVLLVNGQVASYGDSQNVVNMYVTNSFTHKIEAKPSNDWRAQACSYVKVECQDKAGQRTASVRHGDDLFVTIEYLLSQRVTKARMQVAVMSADGLTICETDTLRSGKLLDLKEGKHQLRVLFPSLTLLTGIYSITLSLTDSHNTVGYGNAQNVLDFEVVHTSPNPPLGIIALPVEWEIPPADLELTGSS